MKRGSRLLVYALSALAMLIYLRRLATTPEPVELFQLSQRVA